MIHFRLPKDSGEQNSSKSGSKNEEKAPEKKEQVYNKIA
jgi:hypothetical protein